MTSSGPRTYRVVVTLQSPDNDPVEIPYYTGPDPVAAMVAVGQNLEADTMSNAVPESVRPVVRSIHIEVTTTTPPWEG